MGTDRLPVRQDVDSGTAALLPDLDTPGGWLLSVDDTPQSYVDVDDPTHLEFEYVRRLGHVLDLVAPPESPVRALHLGGGALTLPRYLLATRPGSRQRVAEVDAALVALVRRELPWGPDIEVVTEDARDVVQATAGASADVVVADVFGGARVPARVTSVEFVAEVARVLDAGGVYLVNIADGGGLDFARAQAATVRAVLPELCLVAEPAVLRGRRFGNIVLAAGPVTVADLRRRVAADPFPARVVTGAALTDLIGDAEPVTDARAADSPQPPDGAFQVP